MAFPKGRPGKKASTMIEKAGTTLSDRKNSLADEFDADAIFSAFGEATLVIASDRRVIGAAGACDTYFSRTASACIGASCEDLLFACADADHRSALYWAIEALIEGYVAPRFFPSRFPFRDDRSVQIVLLDGGRIVVRALLDKSREVDRLIHDQLKLALSSAVGFTDVILKGIGGPLTDIQVEDLDVIRREAQFALDLSSDLRALYLVPSLQGPVPQAAVKLLTLSGDDLPQRQLATQHVELNYQLPESLWVYSNGAIRACVASVVRLLAQYAERHSRIVISANAEDDRLVVSVTYTPADLVMHVPHHIDPTALSERRGIKQEPRIFPLISSLHAYLSATGCAAWADRGHTPDDKASVISMTVPLWNGPTNR
ncbi:MAG TPA: hypothetical protein VKQ72_04205 [Aggregatilineales bacterium]|nr:hypothetical protein [Aggregatilineales bacterium]